MNPKARRGVFVVLVFLMLPAWSHASTISLLATLDGSQEVKPNGSPGTGTGNLTYDDLTNELSWNISFSNLWSGTKAANFYGPASPGVKGAVQVPISLGAYAGKTSGTLIGMATLTSTQETQLLSDLWYINILTSACPCGEIRGQVQVSAVPLPAAVWLLGSGVLGLGALARRRVG